MSASPPFQAAIFFDNAAKHIAEVETACPHITCVKIPETSIHSPMLHIDSPAMVDYINNNGLQSNSYLALTNRLTDGHHGYDIMSGIGYHHVENFNSWEEHTNVAGPNRVLILDWDRTITIMEGFTLPAGPAVSFVDNGILNALLPSIPRDIIERAPALQEVTVLDTLLFLCGGQTRCAAIGKWLNDVAIKGIHIMILTNNGACVASPNLFRELVTALLNGYANYSIGCSSAPIYNGNKGAVLMDDARFATLCPRAVGGRRNKNRKINTRRHYKNRKINNRRRYKMRKTLRTK